MSFLNRGTDLHKGLVLDLNGRNVTVAEFSIGRGTANVTMPDGSTKIVGLDKLKDRK
jgi:hypothetical protein